MAYWLYNALLILASPLWGAWLLWRLIGQRKDRRGFRQRWGGLKPGARQTAPERAPRIWIHAVSVGEVMAVAPVVRALRRQFPQALLVGSTVTDLGQETMRAKLPELDLVFYLPFDLWWSVRRTIRTIHPTLFLFAEMELWPNVLLSLERAGVPAVLVNGRVSERSARRYRRVAPFIRWVVETIDALAVQREDDRGRFIQLGADPARVTVCGNLKADGAVAAATDSQRLKQALGMTTETLIVAGSTHHPEEIAVARAFLALVSQRPELRLCLAPRHLDRCAAIEADLRGLGLLPLRRSTLPASGRTWSNPREVVLLDTIGELMDGYHAASMAVMGGTFAPIGGHNLLEPAAARCPVIMGPHVGQWAAIAEGLVAAGGAVALPADAELEPALRELLRDAARRDQMGAAARGYLLGQQGATDRTMEVIRQQLESGMPHARRVAPRALFAWWLGASGGMVATLKALLRPLAWGYGWLMVLRREAYRRGWLGVSRLSVVVVSVGNLTVGGSGKTPMVVALAEWLQRSGQSVGVVLRGYGGRRSRDPLLVSDGRTVTAAVEEAGDEAVLLARRLPGVPVAVGRRRTEAGRLLIERCAPQLLLIDDGFQHLALARDVNLLLVDTEQPLVGGRPLPVGSLRERWSAVRDASAILFVDRLGEGWRDDVVSRWLPHLRRRGFTGPLFSARLRPAELIVCASGERRPLEILSRTRVAICSSVGQPHAFREMVNRAGASVVAEWVFGDHHDYARADMAAIAAEAHRRGAAMVVTTEKDAVKLTDWPAPAPPLVALRVAMKIEHEAKWHDWLMGQKLFHHAAARLATVGV